MDLKEVLSDVGKILKAMSASSIKKFSVEEGVEHRTEEPMPEPEMLREPLKVAVMEVVDDVESGTGLLDSATSHPMRPAKGDEYRHGEPVRVTLAGEDVRVLRQNRQGTILVQEEETQIQPLVPLGAVIENLGYTLHWSPRNLRLTHPTKKSVKVKIKNHCPEVAACDALNLIEELEMSQMVALNTHVESLRARLEVMKKEEKRDWTELLKEFARTGSRATLLKALLLCPFTKDLPADVHNLMLQGFDLQGREKYLKSLPLTRRKRRALMRSSSWVVSLISGGTSDKNDPFEAIPLSGKVVLEVDLEKSKLWDLHREGGVYALLLWAAATGRVSDMIAVPPCATWPTSLAPRRGPESYPKRSMINPYGVEGLTSMQKQEVDKDTAWVAKSMSLWAMAQMCTPGEVGFA